ncbi:glycosyltransferase family 87 protein [uncultured Mucilaginibacter sp.]|uniref:glycosyltransferase family 87 protein n=1 Tax=uncultured Mucilaginibacter sp. TaxID=797541 RepID=UPI0025CC40D1|nr:glycosyltransferase family 87 protein [uncultured Mucilaginibacter sp.]
MQKIKAFFTNKYVVLGLWFGLATLAAFKQVLTHGINNYLLYKWSWLHLIQQKNIYLHYPALFEDCHHYGPFFGLIIAPFSVFPDYIGVMLWSIFNTFMLYKAVTMLPLDPKKQLLILLICAHELMTSSFSVQVNPFITALILFSFIFIRREKDFWAALMIIIGTYIKLYGIVGLAFFFFSDHKWKLIWGLVFWSVVLMGLTMLVSTPHFVIQSYYDWYHSLAAKDIENNASRMQDIGVKGMIRRIFDIRLSDITVLIPGVIVFFSSYIRIGNFKSIKFQLLILASTLIFPIIFSSSSESPTYIIAFMGVAIWYMNLDRPVTNFEIFLIIFALVITSFSPSDLFPRYLSEQVTKKYGLKALPVFVVWLKIIYETWTRDFNKEETPILATAS